MPSRRCHAVWTLASFPLILTFLSGFRASTANGQKEWPLHLYASGDVQKWKQLQRRRHGNLTVWTFVEMKPLGGLSPKSDKLCRQAAVEWGLSLHDQVWNSCHDYLLPIPSHPFYKKPSKLLNTLSLRRDDVASMQQMASRFPVRRKIGGNSCACQDITCDLKSPSSVRGFW